MKMEIEKIREAEAKAAELKEKMMHKAEDAEKRAMEQGRKVIVDAVSDASGKAEALIKKAEDEASEMLARKKAEAQKAAKQMVMSAESRIDGAAHEIAERIMKHL